MSVFIGHLFGGLLAVAMFALIISRFAFRQDPPFHRASKTVAAAVIIPTLISLWGNGPELWFQMAYLIPAPFVWWVQYRHYCKHWQDDEIPDVFR